MNWTHLQTFIWLRWRLFSNQMRRGGVIATVLSAILTVLMFVGGVISLFVGFAVGFFALRNAPPYAPMIAWDAAVAGFAFFWMIGLMAELQRSDLLSLDRFMHLPVSPRGAFLINYVGSSLSLSLVLFLPGMTGLAAGLLVSRGPIMFLLFPLVAAFFLMVTALTYQFRGWLAGMMANPRRRRAIVTFITLLFILVFQLPNLVTNFSPAARARREARQEFRRTMDTLNEQLASGAITREELEARRPEPPPAAPDFDPSSLRPINLYVPLGWLPYGVDGAATGRAGPALAGILGMGLIGALSLQRAYRTTMRMYLGEVDSSRRSVRPPRARKAAAEARETSREATFLERRLPGISDRSSAIALASFRSLARAPEVKMMLLTPVFMLIVFTGMSRGGANPPPELLRPLIATGISAFVLVLGLIGFVGNQFGFDRTGFRAYVLVPARRREILMGKNLAMLPLALVMMGLGVALYQWLHPMRIDHLLAVLIQMVPLYLVFALAGNLLSIISPMALRMGSGMPANHQGIKMIYQFVFMALVPIPLSLTLLPLGIEAFLGWSGRATWFPAFLIFGVIQAVAAIGLYHLVLDWEGALLQRREQRILEVVASRGE